MPNLASPRTLDFKATLLGAAVGLGLSFLFVMLAAALLWAIGGSHAEPVGMVTLVGVVALGCICSALGGHVAASRAGHHALLHGVAAGIAMVAVSLLLSFGATLLMRSLPSFASQDPMPIWLSLGSNILAVVAATLGGWLHAARPRQPSMA